MGGKRSGGSGSSIRYGTTNYARVTVFLCFDCVGERPERTGDRGGLRSNARQMFAAERGQGATLNSQKNPRV